jgi:hypothetical protein
LQIYWPPLTGLIYGGALDGFGLWFLVAVQFAQTLIAFTAVYLILRPWGRRWAWLTVGLWVTYLAHQVYFHLFGADPLTLFLNIMWILCVRWAIHYQKPGFWFLLGVAVGISILARAGNFVLLSALLATLMLIYESRNLDGLKAVAYRCTLAVAGFALFAVPYLVYNGLRYDSFVLARAGQTVWFKSVYSTESLLEIENGPATRQFASLVEEELLVTDLYADVTLEEFLSQPSFRTRDDSISLVDRELGWDSNYQLLRDVSFEAIRAHPAEYVRYRLRDFARTMAIKALLPGASIQSDTTEEVVFTTEAVYSTFFFNRPDGTLPNAAEVASIHEELNALLEPTTRYTGNNDIKSLVVDIWIRFGLHPVLAILVAVPYGILASPGRTRLFVMVLLVGMAGVVLPASMAAVQDRYRLTMDLVFIIAVVLAALHFTRWVSQFRR